MRRPQFKRPRALVLGAILLALVIIGVNGVKLRRGLTAYCQETPRGEALVRAEERAHAAGLRFVLGSTTAEGRGHALVSASGVLGRIACEIEHDGSMVIRSTLRFND